MKNKMIDVAMTTIVSILAAMLMFYLFAMAAHAQGQGPTCRPHAEVVDALAERYGETRQVVGLGPNGVMVEVFGNTESGTWTIITTTPDLVSCFVTAGSNFENWSEELPPAGDDA